MSTGSCSLFAVRTRTHPVDPEHPSTRHVVRAAWSCFEPPTRRKLVISGLIAALLATLDAAAVGLLPTLVHRFQGSRTGLLSGISTPVLGGAAVLLLIVKSTGGALLLYWQASFLTHDEAERTIGLFHHLFHRPYGETSGINSSQFIRDLHVAVPLLYRGAGAGLGLLIADGLGLVGLGIILLVSAPLTGLVLVVFLVGAARVYASLIRSRVSRLSNRYHDQNADFLNDLNESFGGLKTLKAFGAESVAVRRFRSTRMEFGLTARDLLFYLQASRYYLEIALVIGLGACIGVSYAIDGRGAVLAVFGLLSGVAARAMPALARGLTSLTNIKIAGAAVIALEPDLRRIEERPPAGEEDRPAGAHANGELPGRAEPDMAELVALEGVSFRYPSALSDVLNDVSLDLRPGELVAIVGETGAGKTTLVDVLVGLLAPLAGTVRRRPVSSVGYVAQETFVWDDTVRFNVSLGRPSATTDAEAEIWGSLEAARVADWVRSLADGLDTQMGERGNRISGGQRQRLGLARALYGHPSILVLDEPTSALDGETSRSLMTTLRTLTDDVGVIVVTHDPIVMEYSDRTVTLGAVAGTAAG